MKNPLQVFLRLSATIKAISVTKLAMDFSFATSRCDGLTDDEAMPLQRRGQGKILLGISGIKGNTRCENIYLGICISLSGLSIT